MRTVVVLPTYNEAENITAALSQITGSDIAADVYVVDDSSPDGTAAIAAAWADQHAPGRITVLSRTVKDGLGAAYRHGFGEALNAGYDRIVQMDADGSHPVEALTRMAAALDHGADLAIGSRYVPGGGVTDEWPRHRKALSRAGNTYARTLLRLPQRDLTGGFKMWDSRTLAAVDMAASNAAGYGFQIQTTVAALSTGARVVEVPIIFRDRAVGTSKMTNAIVVEAMLAVLTMRPAARAARLAQRLPHRTAQA